MKPMGNTPKIKMGLVAVSRDCFPIELSRERLKKVVAECRKLKLNVFTAKTIVETDSDALKAVAEMERNKVDAITIYLGNFGPEGPTTILAKNLGAPFMLCGAAEESKDTLIGGRGDALCGMLSVSFNCGLRNIRAYIPPRPIALPEEIAKSILHFTDIARVVVGIRNLKAFSFGPRPQDFYTCNAPIKPLYDLGIEVMENSELDMYQIYQSASGQTDRIKAIANDMAKELGSGNKFPKKLMQLAQFELALLTFMEKNLGARRFGVFANKCWPAFEKSLGFVPCYVNSRLRMHGIPASCETDIYGAVSEYMAQLASSFPVTLLDVNNSVPSDIGIPDLNGAAAEDLFMGFHCGNTPSCCLKPGYCMKYQLIMNRLMESGKKPDITCGTLEGTLAPGPITIFRLQATPSNEVQSYLAEGHVVDADPCSFGGIGIIAIKDFARFYRHVLLEKHFAHHTAAAFRHAGRVLFDATRLIGVENIYTPRTVSSLYPSENPFAE